MDSVKASLAAFVLSMTLSPAGLSQGFGGGMGSGGHGGDDFPGHRGLELEHNLVLPQVAVGRDVSTQLILANLANHERTPWLTSEELETSGEVLFFGQNGDPLEVRVNGAPPANRFAFRLDAAGVEFLDVSSEGPNTPGWALISVNDPEGTSDWGSMDDHAVSRGQRLTVTAFYTIYGGAGRVVSEVGVAPAEYERGRFGNSSMAAIFGGGANTGVAVVNTAGETASFTATLRDATGQVVGTRTISLSPGNQRALFIDQLFEGNVPEGFRGSLEFSTGDEGVVVMGLLMNGPILTSFPTRHFGSWTRGGNMMP